MKFLFLFVVNRKVKKALVLRLLVCSGNDRRFHLQRISKFRNHISDDSAETSFWQALSYVRFFEESRVSPFQGNSITRSLQRKKEQKCATVVRSEESCLECFLLLGFLRRCQMIEERHTEICIGFQRTTIVFIVSFQNIWKIQKNKLFSRTEFSFYHNLTKKRTSNVSASHFFASARISFKDNSRE